MSCFACFSSQKSKRHSKRDDSHRSSSCGSPKSPENVETTSKSNQAENESITAQPFTFRDLAAATKNFRQECLLGEGGFGKVYKGTLQATGQVVAVKQLDRNAMLENKNFLVEVAKLSHIQHPNLVNLIGYCADGDQRLLVYEFMPNGSIEDHLHGEGNVLDWITRMKIAYGAAQGLEYLHDKTTPIIYRDLKSSNVLLDEQLNPKLSDIGLDKLEPLTDKIPMQSREMGTYGYSAPEFSRSGSLTPVSDVYSFGVVLLELITGRRVMDTSKSVDEQNLVSWAQPIFKDPKRYPELADPLLKKRFPERDLNQAVGIIAMCLQDEAGARPMMSDVVTALSFLSMATPESCNHPTTQDSESEHESNQDDDDDDDDNDDVDDNDDDVDDNDDDVDDNDDDDDDDDNDDDDDVDDDDDNDDDNDDDDVDDDDDMHNISGSRSSSNRSRSINSNGESRSTLDYSRRSSYGIYSREEMNINDSSIRRKESQSSISQNDSEEFEGSSARSTSRKSSVGKSSRKNSDDGNVSNRSRKSLSRKASRAGDESHSSVSSKKNSRRTKKTNENIPHSSSGVSQDEIQLVHNH